MLLSLVASEKEHSSSNAQQKLRVRGDLNPPLGLSLLFVDGKVTLATPKRHTYLKSVANDLSSFATAAVAIARSYRSVTL